MKKLILVLVAISMTACSQSENGSGETTGFASKTYDNQQDAQNDSPTGEVCLVSGELKTEIVCIPDNRGKNGNCTNQEVVTDTRIWEVAYLRGDVDYDGRAGTRDDAQLATKKLYVKQLDNQPCPAAADIAPHEGIHDSFEPDGFFTSNDINKWRDVFTGKANLPQYPVICASQCQVINHMSPEFK